jgi:hypothetical protein
MMRSCAFKGYDRTRNSAAKNRIATSSRIQAQENNETADETARDWRMFVDVFLACSLLLKIMTRFALPEGGVV